MSRITALSVFVGFFFAVGILPLSASAWGGYGAGYQGTASNYQPYYQPMQPMQPMYAYAYSPAQSYQSTYINYPQQNYSYGYPQQYSYGYGAPQYSYYPQQYSYPQYNSYPQYSYPNYGYGGGYGGGGGYGPSGYGTPTGDTNPWLGGELCTFPGYDGRANCGSNPRQFVYDHWTGTWY